MEYLRLALPLAMLLYCLVRAWRNRIFLLGIPFLQFIGSSVFFDRIRVFWMPGRFEPSVHILIWLAAVWFLCAVVWRDESARSDPLIPQLRWFDLLVITLGMFVCIDVAISVLKSGHLMVALQTAWPYLALFIGYFLIRGIVSVFSREAVVAFLDTLTTFSVIAALLFIGHQVLPFPIYESVPNSVTVFMNQVLSRDFVVMSPLLFFTAAWCIAKGFGSPRHIVQLIICSVAVVLSYTRSMLLIVLTMLVIVVMMYPFVRRQLGEIGRHITGLSLIAITVFMVVSFALPIQFQFLMSRLQESLTTPGGIPTNMVVRQQHLAAAVSLLRNDDELMFGVGFPSDDSNSAIITRWTADSVWVSIVYRLGLAGISLFVLLFVAFAGLSLRLVFTPKSGSLLIGTAFLLIVIATFCESFVSWTVLSPTRVVLGFWFLAFLGSESVRATPAMDSAPRRTVVT